MKEYFICERFKGMIRPFMWSPIVVFVSLLLGFILGYHQLTGTFLAMGFVLLFIYGWENDDSYKYLGIEEFENNEDYNYWHGEIRKKEAEIRWNIN